MKQTKHHKNPQKTKQDKAFTAILAQVMFDGWGDKAYQNGLKKAGIGAGEAAILFPHGILDVIEVFGKRADDAMAKAIEKKPRFESLRVREKVAFALRARLEHQGAEREAVRRLLYWYAMPSHIPLGIKRLYRTVDLIWRAAGDNATDFNFYTKRALLAGVVKTTTLFWLNDESAGRESTWEFLDRRISEVLKLGKSISLMREWPASEWIGKIRSVIKV